jgi:hypothetical protein
MANFQLSGVSFVVVDENNSQNLKSKSQKISRAEASLQLDRQFLDF